MFFANGGAGFMTVISSGVGDFGVNPVEPGSVLVSVLGTNFPFCELALLFRKSLLKPLETAHGLKV